MDLRTIRRVLLYSWGYDSLIATPEDVDEKLQSGRFDLVLLSLMLGQEEKCQIQAKLPARPVRCDQAHVRQRVAKAMECAARSGRQALVDRPCFAGSVHHKDGGARRRQDHSNACGWACDRQDVEKYSQVRVDSVREKLTEAFRSSSSSPGASRLVAFPSSPVSA